MLFNVYVQKSFVVKDGGGFRLNKKSEWLAPSLTSSEVAEAIEFLAKVGFGSGSNTIQVSIVY